VAMLNGQRSGAKEVLAKLMILFDSRFNGLGEIDGKKRHEAAKAVTIPDKYLTEYKQRGLGETVKNG